MEDKIKNEALEGKEISNEALEGVSGGSSYSSDTYEELDISWCGTYQNKYSHPLIVTWGNSCNLHPDKSCASCDWSAGVVPMYCMKRSAEYDPVNGTGTPNPSYPY